MNIQITKNKIRKIILEELSCLIEFKLQSSQPTELIPHLSQKSDALNTASFKKLTDLLDTLQNDTDLYNLLPEDLRDTLIIQLKDKIRELKEKLSSMEPV
jgi:hypothetical protein